MTGKPEVELFCIEEPRGQKPVSGATGPLRTLLTAGERPSPVFCTGCELDAYNAQARGPNLEFWFKSYRIRFAFQIEPKKERACDQQK